MKRFALASVLAFLAFAPVYSASLLPLVNSPKSDSPTFQPPFGLSQCGILIGGKIPATLGWFEPNNIRTLRFPLRFVSGGNSFKSTLIVSEIDLKDAVAWARSLARFHHGRTGAAIGQLISGNSSHL